MRQTRGVSTTRAVIVDVVRTASGRGKPGGALSTVHPADLLATTIKALVERTGIDPGSIDDVIAGCVGQGGDQAQNIARTAALAARLPETVPATTIDRQCGSSQQAMHFAAQGVIAGAYDVVIACGVESMSRVPMFSPSAGGDPLGPLAGRYPDGLVNQGISAELIAARWKLSRDDLDAYAARSHRLAAETTAAGAFDSEIVPVTLADGATHDPRSDDPTRHHGRAPRRARAEFRQRGDGSTIPGDRLVDHAGKLLPAHRRRLRRADHERGQGQ